jgi:site-specific recombinase XerD
LTLYSGETVGRIAKPYYRKETGWWVATVAGRPRTKLLTGKPTAADERKALEIFNRLVASTNPRASLDNSQCANVVELFLDHTLAKGKPSDADDSGSTYSTYRRHLNWFTGYCGRVICRDLTLQHAERFLVKQARKATRRIERTITRKDGTERKQVNVEKPWQANMQATFSKILKSCFNWAVESDLISRNPFAKLKRSFKDTDRDIVDEGTWQQLIDGAKGEPFRNFLTAIRNTGCRPSEVAKVTAANVKGATWSFAKHKTDGTGKVRVVYLNAVMQELTGRLIEKHPTGPLFLNARGKAWTKDAIVQRFESLRTRLGLSDHVIAYAAGRHTWITGALTNGVPKSVVAHMAGTSEKMIDKHYSHLDSRAADMLASAEQATRQSS